MQPPPAVTDLTRRAQTDPLAVYRYRDGLYAVDLLTAAICEFDIFTWLAEHPTDAAGVARHFGFAARPLDVMLTLFTADGFVRQDAGVFHVTDVAREHLVRTSPFFLGPYYASLKDRPVVRDFVAILRTDRPANWGSYGHEKTWTEAMLTDEFAATFTAAMDCRGAVLGPALAEAVDLRDSKRLLDVAGGSGIFACTLVAHHPHLQATVLERPPVDQVARAMIRKRGFENRVAVEAGDMFAAPLPSGYDVHLFSNVLHDWGVDKVRALLRASAAALSPGGLIVIHDAHLDRAKAGPLPVARYSALLMSVTEGKCYSLGEMEALLAEAGFREVSFRETAVDRSVITARLAGGAVA